MQRSARQSWLLQLLVAGALLGTASAGKIIWRSLARAHETSDRMPLSGEMVFELGVFSDGFEPTPENVALWSEHWNLASATSFDESEGRFSSTFTVSSNALPFQSGTKGYIWGRQDEEWVLMTGEGWKWPTADPLSFSVTWSTVSADAVIVGALSQDASEAHLQTAEVRLPLSPEAWRSQHFQSSEEDAWEADPDADGLSNQLEYALGLDPKRFDLDLPLELTEDGRVILERDLTRAVTLRAEFSVDLVGWSTDPPLSWELVSETASEQTFLMGQETRPVFLRVRADW